MATGAVMTDENNGTKCSACNKIEGSLKKCTGCQIAAYCSKVSLTYIKIRIGSRNAELVRPGLPNYGLGEWTQEEVQNCQDYEGNMALRYILNSNGSKLRRYMPLASSQRGIVDLMP
jgi:hypothetical protein